MAPHSAATARRHKSTTSPHLPTAATPSHTATTPSSSQRGAKKLRAKGAPVHVTASKAKAVHHTWRYIVGGIVVILIGVAVAALLTKRRRDVGALERSGDSG
jgi:hypothetical protein